MRHFLILLSITFLNLKILGFPFSTKNSLTWEVKCEIRLQKIVGNLLDKLRKLYMNGIENYRQYLLLQTDI